MIFVDSGFFVGLFNKRDALRPVVLRWVRALDEPLILTHYILIEVANTFSHPSQRQKVHAFVSHLAVRRYEVVAASDELLTAGLRLHQERPDKSWSLTDCISFVVMDRRGIQRALTHDHHFEQAGYDALLRRDPP